MKVKDIAKEYGIDSSKFTLYLESIGAGKSGLMGYTLDDDIEGHVERFKAEITARKAEEDAIKKAMQEAENEKQQALANMLISSGFSFDGYRIVKYSGYISGDDATQMPRSYKGIFKDTTKDNNEELTKALVKIRHQALKELKEAAYDLGCNAVIGVDFDYLTLDPETVDLSGHHYLEPYLICVTANGNAVVIEKE